VRVVEICPCKAGEAVAGAWAKVSRSRRTAVDCFNAALKRTFCLYDQPSAGAPSCIDTYHLGQLVDTLGVRASEGRSHVQQSVHQAWTREYSFAASNLLQSTRCKRTDFWSQQRLQPLKTSERKSRSANNNNDGLRSYQASTNHKCNLTPSPTHYFEGYIRAPTSRRRLEGCVTRLTYPS
jgi:hypothetical protein